jgi:hypothetical protein
MDAARAGAWMRFALGILTHTPLWVFALLEQSEG